MEDCGRVRIVVLTIKVFVLKIVLGLIGILGAICVRGEVVHVFEQTVVGGVTNRLSDTTKETGGDYVTQSAPPIAGFIFTGWTTDAKQAFVSRDALGRSFDVAPYHLYESMTLTANYLDESIDSDGDGIADGYEFYWYGDLSKDAASDTDGDGYGFAAELAAGTNPLMKDRTIIGGVVYEDSDELLYNPHGYAPLTIRSEPDGELFATTVEYLVPGTAKAGPACDSRGTSFAYWMTNGVPVRDALGRAVDSVTFEMPNSAVELVAVCVENETERQKMYWYGTTDVALDSDTDGDGYTFAQELAAGTNPLMKDRTIIGGVVYEDSEELEYNPNGYRKCVIRSEPEGVLFDSVTSTVRAGDSITTPNCAGLDGFACWRVDGVDVRDLLGRAVDSVSILMPNHDSELVAVCVENEEERTKLYWYGTADVALDSDTDGDGYTFAQELAAGTNPLMKDRTIIGGVVYEDTDTMEANLQPFEQVQGFVVNGNFLIPELAGRAAWPVVADVNGDGLWDVVVCYEGGARVFVNVGSRGNPEFEERTVDLSAVDLAMNSTEKLVAMALDVVPVDALSATVCGETMLVSDTEGRIWYYIANRTIEQSNNSYTLQHKVWGGSFAGFAKGLRLAAVDWDDDGDIDCLCGTAEGKLVLLRDPKVGRPTNLKALVGVDNVKLDWDPNAQSRIRGYKVYRADAGAEDFASLVSPYTPLPTYRDYPPSVSDYDYKVSSVSRHYVAGNSTPIESESPATEAVRATLGKVKFFWNDVVVKQGERAEVMLSIENSLNYDVAGKTQVVTYDPAYLTPLKIVKTGLTENVSYEESVADGKWTITLKSGELAAGGGKFLTFVFDTLKVGTTKVGKATVTIAARQEPAPYRLGDMSGDGIVDKDDLRELAKLKNAASHKWTADQLKAGDFNGNGVLDNADYQALRDLLKERGLL